LRHERASMPPKKNAVAARIKRLMQADDEVGKIAQATPVLMAKALDLFLEELMKSTTDIASSHGAKTVSAGHLRASIMGNEKFDFLKEIVDGVPDLPTEPGKKPVVGSLEGEEARAGSSSLKGGHAAAGGSAGEPTKAKRDRTRKPQASAKVIEEGEDDERVPKVARGVGSEYGHRGSLVEEHVSTGYGAQNTPAVGGALAGTLEEAPKEDDDDDYDEL